DQVRQLVDVLELDRSRSRPFTICLECNRPLEERDREAIKERLPPYVYLTQDRFAECPSCGRLYWQGTHWQAMSREMDGIPDAGDCRPH
ncbi:MAG: Mut7-C RNAse domain-containing protein, partial [Deltaproteobacteria bacterium]|nr:Mut7-C RNAse domain-containing protein [Deltaproteobacteria bacterium]